MWYPVQLPVVHSGTSLFRQAFPSQAIETMTNQPSSPKMMFNPTLAARVAGGKLMNG